MRNPFSTGRGPAYHVRVHWPTPRPDGNQWWLVTFEELPGCMVQGRSMSEAEARLWRILPGYLKEMRKNGQPAPKALETPAPSIEGISVVMAPSRVQRSSDSVITTPIPGIGELHSAASRADASLLGS